MPLIATKGAASAQGFGEFAQTTEPVYIEQIFSTYLYTGNGSTQTITNNIDLSTKGGLVWIKGRESANAYNHVLYDSNRGTTKRISSNTTSAEDTASGVTAFNSNGFTIGSNATSNENTYNYVSWTFREQPKFFDIVTYTGNGTTQAINHNLGSTPGCVIVKRTNDIGNWFVWHRSLSAGYRVLLNATNAQTNTNSATIFGNNTTYVDPTSTNFTVGNETAINNSGDSFVAYLFAHDAGGFGASGSDNVISCGSFTTDGSGNATVNLGYEPQWILQKKATGFADNWSIYDTMRGITAIGSGSNAFNASLYPNSSDAEATTSSGAWSINSTGFQYTGGVASATWVYVAIRRGPMKTPTSGTSVFIPSTWTGNGNTGRTISSLTSPVDLAIVSALNSQIPKLLFSDRLRGSGTGENSGNMKTLTSTSTVAESNSSLNGYYATLDYQDSVRLLGSSSGIYNNSGTGNLLYSFRRAPGFFDVVCYAGTGSTTTQTHNLGVVPEMMIHKVRNGAVSAGWAVYVASLGADNTLSLNNNNPVYSSPNNWNSTTPTASVFTVGTSTSGETNYAGTNYVAYLFATLPGISKVGTYTGTGTTQTINCGFTAGSRFVLIKRTDSTGDWYVWDSARGIVAGNDPYLLLNSTAAEVTNTDYVDTANSGFEISSTAPAAINANGGTFIFFAVA